jgi:hypothetical protein
VKALDQTRLVFLRTSARPTSLSLPSTPEHLKGSEPSGRRQGTTGCKNLTLIASSSIEGVGAAMSVEGVTDRAAFETYVEHFLVPTLKEG